MGGEIPTNLSDIGHVGNEKKEGDIFADPSILDEFGTPTLFTIRNGKIVPLSDFANTLLPKESNSVDPNDHSLSNESTIPIPEGEK